MKYIVAASDTKTLRAQEHYIFEKTQRKDCLFLGIFDNKTGEHIGNIKYEPICFDSKEAVMGVLIGNPMYRGKNVFHEVFWPVTTGYWKIVRSKKIILGVDRTNIAAINAYKNQENMRGRKNFQNMYLCQSAKGKIRKKRFFLIAL